MMAVAERKDRSHKQVDGREVMLATLGSEPQVVTLSLDMLLAARNAIDEVIVVYTDNPVIKENLDILQEEFKLVYPDIVLRPVPVSNAKGLVEDFFAEEDLHGLLRTLYIETRRVRQTGRRLHMCISGGRKVIAVIYHECSPTSLWPG